MAGIPVPVDLVGNLSNSGIHLHDNSGEFSAHF